MYFDKEFEQAKGKFRAVNVRGGQCAGGPGGECVCVHPRVEVLVVCCLRGVRFVWCQLCFL